MWAGLNIQIWCLLSFFFFKLQYRSDLTVASIMFKARNILPHFFRNGFNLRKSIFTIPDRQKEKKYQNKSLIYEYGNMWYY